MKVTGEIYFGNLLLHSTLICLATDTLHLYEFFKSWKSVIIKRKKKSRPNHRRICMTCKLEKQLFRIVCCAENLNYCKISKSNNVAGATLLRSLSAVDILLPVLQELRNIFLKKHLKKAAQATCTCFNVITLHSSSHQRCSIKIAILKTSAKFTGKHLRWSLFWINFSKKRLQHRCFPVNIMKFLRAPIFQNIFARLLLYVSK